jgi:hypothetical protein
MKPRVKGSPPRAPDSISSPCATEENAVTGVLPALFNSERNAQQEDIIMGAIGFIELAGVSAVAAMLTLAPQNSARNAQNSQNPQSPQHERGAAQGAPKASDEVTVTGCLTANARGDRFVLTPLKRDPLSAEMTSRTTDAVPTYTYELSGGTNLRAHIGQQVSVTGKLDRGFEQDAEVDRDRQTQAAPASPNAPKPTVETEEKAEVELRRLQVNTVKSIGKPCDTPTS